MTKGLKRVGRAVGLGLGWAVVWAPAAVLIGLGIVDPDNSMDEMWAAIGAYPGFLGGVLFYALLGVAERGRRLDELPVSRAALLGAVVGLPIGVLPFAIGEPATGVPLWQLAGTFAGVVVLSSALSAVGSALVSRAWHRRRPSVEDSGMTRRYLALLALPTAAFLFACGGNPAPGTPADAPTATAAQAPEGDGLSDERVMELARGYTALLHAGEWEQLWGHLNPEARDRFESFDNFSGAGAGILARLGAEMSVVSESVEPARSGMIAEKVYLRVSNYTGVPGRQVRVMIGLMSDGSIAGMQVRPVD